MSETSDLLAATATRLFETRFGDDAARASRKGEFSDNGWAAIEEAGLPLALLSEEEGGFGLDTSEALNLVRLHGYFAAPAPLGETMLANLLLARAGLALAEGPAVIAPLDANGAIERAGDAWKVQGLAPFVPWGRHATTIVVVAGDRVARVAATSTTIAPVFSACGLPRDSVAVDSTVADGAVGALPGAFAGKGLQAGGALLRSLEMAGALEQVVELTVSYAGERIQFGRPIGKQQAVQQQLATLAAQAAAANAAADFAALAFGTDGAVMAAAVAKSRVGEAAGIGAAIAHQVHGAIGFTEEHRLHLFTRALWASRDEYGTEAAWQAMLGGAALDAGADGFWPFVTRLQPCVAEA